MPAQNHNQEGLLWKQSHVLGCFTSVLAVCMKTDSPTETNVFSPGIDLISLHTPSSDRLTAAASTFCLALDF